MPFYLTRDPVPSADMRNVFDNAQNLDLFLNDITSAFWTDRLGRSRMSWFGMESAFTVKLTDFESRFATKLTAQETAFDAAQADKEARFVHFLDSSGYVFLGDYEDGPFQFSARNQYIRFQGQFFRLSKETDTGFTTTGTDETSFANDVTHLVLMDGDTLRQNLGSGEGDPIVAPEKVRVMDGNLADAIKYQTLFMHGGADDYDSVTKDGTDNYQPFKDAIDTAIANSYQPVIVDGGDFFIDLTVPGRDYIDLGGSNFSATNDAAGALGVQVICRGRTRFIVKFPHERAICFISRGGSGSQTTRGIHNAHVIAHASCKGWGLPFVWEGACISSNSECKATECYATICLHNKESGQFTEKNKFYDFRNHNCKVGLLYKITNGDNSFHGNEFIGTQMNIYIENDTPANSGSGIAFEVPEGKRAHPYFQKFDIRMFGGAGAKVIDLQRATVDYSECDITIEGGGILRSQDDSWFHCHGNFSNYNGGITLDCPVPPRLSVPASFIFYNMSSSRALGNFTYTGMTDWYSQTFDINNSDRMLNSCAE